MSLAPRAGVVYVYYNVVSQPSSVCAMLATSDSSNSCRVGASFRWFFFRRLSLFSLSSSSFRLISLSRETLLFFLFRPEYTPRTLVDRDIPLFARSILLVRSFIGEKYKKFECFSLLSCVRFTDRLYF